MNRQRLREQLIQDEGVVYEIYKDHRGFKTFGIGHLVKRHDEEYDWEVGTPVSEERVWSAFDEDLDIAINDCLALYDDFESWPAEVQEILVNMVFNLGRPGLSRFVMFKSALQKNDWQLAAQYGRDSLWYRQVTNRAERLMSRLEQV